MEYRRKYNIAAELEKFPEGKPRAKKRREIMTACNVQPKTLSTWENLPEGSTTEIGIDKMVHIARIVGCELETLLTQHATI